MQSFFHSHKDDFSCSSVYYLLHFQSRAHVRFFLHGTLLNNVFLTVLRAVKTRKFFSECNIFSEITSKMLPPLIGILVVYIASIVANCACESNWSTHRREQTNLFASFNSIHTFSCPLRSATQGGAKSCACRVPWLYAVHTRVHRHAHAVLVRVRERRLVPILRRVGVHRWSHCSWCHLPQYVRAHVQQSCRGSRLNA